MQLFIGSQTNQRRNDTSTDPAARRRRRPVRISQPHIYQWIGLKMTALSAIYFQNAFQAYGAAPPTDGGGDANRAW